MTFDVVIVGGGPVGLTEACLLKSLNPKLKIRVLEERDEVKRDYGLTVKSDAIKRINQLINKALVNAEDKNDLQELKKLITDWGKYSSVRTSEIQTQLTKRAHALGIEILKGKDHKFIVSQENGGLSDELKKARVIIGADGAHSAVRQSVMGPDKDNLVDKKAYEYVLELKYNFVRGQPKAKKIEARVFKSIDESNFENHSVSITGKEVNGVRPHTDIIFVKKEVHKGFLKKNEKGEIVKGTSGKAWTWAELEEESKSNPVVLEYKERITQRVLRQKHIHEATNLGCEDVKIGTIPIEIYRSKTVAKVVDGRPVLLVGDASSGLVLQRGFNKGLIQAADLAEATLYYLKDENKEALNKYQKNSDAVFLKEKWWIELWLKPLKIKQWYLQKVQGPAIRALSSGIIKIIKIIKVVGQLFK